MEGEATQLDHKLARVRADQEALRKRIHRYPIGVRAKKTKGLQTRAKNIRKELRIKNITEGKAAPTTMFGVGLGAGGSFEIGKRAPKEEVLLSATDIGPPSYSGKMELGSMTEKEIKKDMVFDKELGVFHRKGADLNGLTKKMKNLFIVIQNAWGIDAYSIISGKRKQRGKKPSRHPSGNALDIRTKHLFKNPAAFDQAGRKVEIARAKKIAKELVATKQGGYRIIIEYNKSRGVGHHLHIAYHPHRKGMSTKKIEILEQDPKTGVLIPVAKYEIK